jgi:hypothetical protein
MKTLETTQNQVLSSDPVSLEKWCTSASRQYDQPLTPGSPGAVSLHVLTFEIPEGSERGSIHTASGTRLAFDSGILVHSVFRCE